MRVRRPSLFMACKLLADDKLQVAAGADDGNGDGLTQGKTVSHLVADDGAELGIGGFFRVAVADSAEVEIRAVPDVSLVLIGPADEAVVAFFRFYEGLLSGGQKLNVGNLTSCCCALALARL
jgi:hypothetical protein